MASLSPRVSTFNSAEEGTTLRPVPACITPTLTREAPALCGGMACRPRAAWALRDGNFRPEELSAIAFGYTKLLEESNEVLTELKNVVNITTLSMTDKERMDVVERCHSKMKRYRNLVSYYTNKNISVSYLRAKKKNDLDRIMGLYGNMNERYW